MQSSAEATEIEQSLRRAIERHAHAVEQIYDPWCRLAHSFHWRLVGQEVAAVNGVVEMLPGGVALALQIFRGIDPALRTDRVRALDRYDGKQFHVPAHLGNLDDRRETCEAASNNYD